MKNFFRLSALVFLLIFASCSDDSDSPSKMSFAEQNAGSWYGPVDIPGSDSIDYWIVLDKAGNLFEWNGEYDGQCGAMKRSRITVVKNTPEEFIFTTSEGDFSTVWTMTNSGTKINVVLEVESLSIEFLISTDSDCYSIVG